MCVLKKYTFDEKNSIEGLSDVIIARHASGFSLIFSTGTDAKHRYTESTRKMRLYVDPAAVLWRFLPRAAANERDAKREGEERLSALFMGVARTSVGRTLNVKPVLSFTRFKGLVTARNHAARAYTLSYPPESVETSASFHFPRLLPSSTTGLNPQT